MKTTILLTLLSLFIVGCGKSEQGATGAATGAATVTNNSPINGVTNVTGSTVLSAFRSKVSNGEFLALNSDRVQYWFMDHSNSSFNREIQNKTTIIRNGDLDQAGATPQEVKAFLLSIIDRAGSRYQMVDAQGTVYRFQVDDKTIYTIDLKQPLAINPIRKEVYSFDTKTFLKIFSFSSYSLESGYYYTGYYKNL